MISPIGASNCSPGNYPAWPVAKANGLSITKPAKAGYLGRTDPRVATFRWLNVLQPGDLSPGAGSVPFAPIVYLDTYRANYHSILVHWYKLFVIFGLIAFVFASPQTQISANHIDIALYATLGPEAPSILRVLIGESHIIAVQSGMLDAVLQQYHITTLILPQDWANDDDLKSASAAGVRVVTLQRHTSVKAIEDNIRTLATLTGTQQTGQHWIDLIEAGLLRIQRNVRGDSISRVLILTPEGYTQGQGTLMTDLLRLTGGINVAAEAGIPEARQIDDSQVRQFAPDVVLLIGWTPKSATTLTLNSVYRGIPAFDRDRIYRIAPLGKDPNYLIEDMDKLVALIHPLSF